MTEPFDQAVWNGLERRLAAVESYIPEPPAWRPVDERLTPLVGRLGRGPAFGPFPLRRAARPLAWALIAVGLVLALVVGTILVGGALRKASIPIRPAHNGAIALESVGPQSIDGSPRILLLDEAGQNLRRFAPDPTDYQRCPSFSPDGRLLAYLGGDYGIGVASVDGSFARTFSGTRAVFQGGVASHGPRWSPDGTRIAFTSQGTGLANEVAILSVGDGSVLTVPIPEVETVLDVAWSPDGRRIAVMGSGGNTTQERDQTSIVVLDADGSNARRVTQYSNGFGDGPLGGISWSPDGSRLAYSRWQVGPNLTDDEIFVMGADGQGETNLTRSASDDIVPAWSPDGRRIAYATTDGTASSVVTVNPDGSDPVVVDRGASVFGLVWSPDATRIIVVPGYDPLATAPVQIHTVAADGSGSGRDIGQFEGGCLPSWQRRLDP